MRVRLESVLLCTTFLADLCVAQDEPVSVMIERGNEMLAQGRTADALSTFSSAIDKDSSNYLTYFKRATTYLAMSRHSAALGDFNKVLDLKPDFNAAISQRGKVMASLGQWDSALEDFTALPDLAEAVAEIKAARQAALAAESAFEKGEAEKCIQESTTAILTAGSSSALRRLRARCHVLHGDADSAIGDLVYATRVNPSDAEVQMLSANLFFFALDDSDRAIQQLKTCLHYDPDAKACKKSFRMIKKLKKSIDAVKSAQELKKWVTAKRALKGTSEQTGLLDVLQTEKEQLEKDAILNANIHLQLISGVNEIACEIFAETKEAQALQMCDAVLASDENSVVALKSKANILLREESFDEAINLLQKANDVTGGQDNGIKEQLNKAHRMLKVSKQKDYYKILGVSRDADTRTIKKRYRTLTKEFHPDKYHGDLSQEQVVKKIEGINEAYEVLSTPELRQRFDNGDDPNAPPEQQHNPFANHGFQHPGGHPFFQQQGGGGGGFGGHTFKFHF